MKELDFSLILVAQGQEMVVDLCCFFCFGKFWAHGAGGYGSPWLKPYFAPEKAVSPGT